MYKICLNKVLSQIKISLLVYINTKFVNLRRFYMYSGYKISIDKHFHV